MQRAAAKAAEIAPNVLHDPRAPRALAEDLRRAA
jgi:hypothetical protein